MTTSRVLHVAFAVATLTACSNADRTTMEVSTTPTDVSRAATPASPTETVALPTSSPAGGTGNLTAGRVQLLMLGDVEVEKSLSTLVSTAYAPPGGGFAIVWTAGGDDATTVGLGGSTFTGTRATSPSLSVSITAQTSDGVYRFVSTAGECDVTIGVAAPDEIAGAIECADLVAASGEVVDAVASFVAAAY
jgi:hypothetical protein